MTAAFLTVSVPHETLNSPGLGQLTAPSAALRFARHPACTAQQRYAHAEQFKRANRALRRLRTLLGRVIRDIERTISDNAALRDTLHPHLVLARARARAEARRAWPQGLQPARPGSGVHRQGQRRTGL